MSFFLSVQIFGQISTVEGLIRKGDSLLNESSSDRAREYYIQAQNFSKDQKNQFYYFFTLYKIGYSFIVDDEEFLALASFTDILLSLNPIDSRDSALFFLSKYEESVILKEAIYSSVDISNHEHFLNKMQLLDENCRKRIYFLFGQYSLQRLEFKKALSYYQQAVRYKTSDIYLDEWSWYYLAICYDQLPEYQRSIEIYEYLLNKGVKFIRKNSLYFYIARIKKSLGHYNTAVLLFQKSLVGISDIRFRISAHGSIGDCYKRMNEFAKAKEQYELAVHLAEEIPEDPVYLAVEYSSLGYYYLQMKEMETAYSFLIKSYQNTYDNNLDLQYKTQIVSLLVEYYNLTEMPYEALEIINSYLASLDSSTVVLTRGAYRRFYNNILFDKARAYLSLWQKNKKELKFLVDAKATMDELIQNALAGYNDLSDDNTKMFFQTRLRKATEFAFEVSYNLYLQTGENNYLNNLLQYSELSKSNIFKAHVENTNRLIGSGIPTELLEKEAQLKKRISRLNYYLEDSNELNDSSKKNLKIALTETTSTHDSLVKSFRTDFEKFDDYKLELPDYDLEKLQEYIDTNQLILNYFIVKNSLYILSIGKTDVDIAEIIPESNISKQILLFREKLLSFSVDNYSKIDQQRFVRVAYELYKLIIKPIEKYTNDKRLIIIPDKELHLIPFEALIKDTLQIDGSSMNRLPFLVMFNPITTLYTTDQLIIKPDKLTLSSNYVGFAPNYKALSNSNNRVLLADLPGAKDEVVKVKKYLNGKVFLNDDASKENFMHQAEYADIMHLALHTIISDINPMYSRLVFSVTEHDTSGDLYTYELYGVNFKSDLVVLSGCNTGNGKIRNGEGLMNLARGFFYGGVKNMLVTQWEVADKSSASLMDYFYCHLSEGTTTDVALQQAKIDYLNNADPLKLHPYYWSGYISVGNPVVFISRSIISWYWFLLILLIIPILVVKSKWNR